MRHTMKSIKFLSMLLLPIGLMTGCFPPVDNYLVESYKNTTTWSGATAAELILIKGNPSKIQYNGWNTKSTIRSEFWSPSLDNYIPLYRDYGSAAATQQSDSIQQSFYEKLNSQGPWLFTYSQPVRSYRSSLRQCHEYYLIGKTGTIIQTGYSVSNILDHQHCPIPLARFNTNSLKP